MCMYGLMGRLAHSMYTCSMLTPHLKHISMLASLTMIFSTKAFMILPSASFMKSPLSVCSLNSSSQSRIAAYVIDFTIGVIDTFCFVTTNASFSTDFVQRQINQLGKDRRPVYRDNRSHKRPNVPALARIRPFDDLTDKASSSISLSFILCLKGISTATPGKAD